jgi:hypothetical protein
MSGDHDAAAEYAALLTGRPASEVSTPVDTYDSPKSTPDFDPDEPAPVPDPDQPRRPRPDRSQGRGIGAAVDPATVFANKLTDALDYPRPRWRDR